jgi:GNAT superfamily N-acetyltransferase
MAPPFEITPLAEFDLAAARAVLAAACAFDRAADVAREKLFEPAPAGAAQAWGAWAGGALAGVAAATADRLRLLAVTPAARGRGAGLALLEAAERAGARRTLDLPGNYLAPGVDTRNTESIAWLERRGWRRLGHEAVNLLIDVRDCAPPAPIAGYQLRRATVDDRAALTAAIAAEFGGAWPFEVARAVAVGGVHVAIADGGELAAFAAHDGNNQGLGWFGPAGTWPRHRGRGLGEALLHACLADVRDHHPVCEVAWIGPRAFYERSAVVVGDRRFAVLTRGPS